MNAVSFDLIPASEPLENHPQGNKQDLPTFQDAINRYSNIDTVRVSPFETINATVVRTVLKIISIYKKLAFGHDVSMMDVPASHGLFPGETKWLSLRNPMIFNHPRDVANKGLTPKTFADLRRPAREASQSAERLGCLGGESRHSAQCLAAFLVKGWQILLEHEGAYSETC